MIDREGRVCKPFASYCILLKKDVEGESESDKQGKQGGEKDERLSKDGEENVEVNAEPRKVG